MSKLLFVDRFVPKSIDKFILPDRIKTELEQGIDGHYLFHGTSGLGKSAVAKMLASNHPYLYINASEQGKIDVLRGEINQFCEEVQINFDDTVSEFKVVLLDEIDGVSQNVFNALKGFMDKYQKNVRFIATTNYINKVDPHVRSRFTEINFNFESSEEEESMRKKYSAYFNALVTKALKKTIEPDALKFIVNKNFPDFRGSLQTIQRLYKLKTDNYTLKDVQNSSYEFKELYELIVKGGQPEDVHKILMGEYANKSAEVLTALDSDFTNFISQSYPKLSKVIPMATIEVWRYQSTLHQVIDPAIAMKACVYTLMGLVNKAKGNG